ncbi:MULTISPECIES: hypothetical protein [Acinetobacter]|uniref:hypothetical protein n=1 Tax=Acinetobacter TaxID=469 RepID=UPI00290A2C01|nr:hypothetical protein [Acinetobacter sp.]MDU6157989.1 hypothetical protein [Acinetobacter sp.]
MDNYKEYLDPKYGYALVKQSVNMPRNPDWIEIPEGSEIAIKFNVDNSGHGVCFYKNNGKLSFSQKNPIWEESEWTQTELLDEDFRNGDVDLTHKVLWIRKPQDSALISGAEALRALADGKEVEANNSDFGYWIDARNLGVKDFFDDVHIFRIKPQTIKVELELPKPFEPKDGERYFYLNPHADAGYGENTTTKWNKYLQFGAWPTEEEIKQVVEQLRKIRGTNS